MNISLLNALVIFDFSDLNFYLYLFIALLNGGLMCYAANKFFQIFQLCGYKIKGYCAWIKDTKARQISRLAMLSFLGIACMIVTNALVVGYQWGEYYSYAGFVFYFYFCMVYIVNVYTTPKKTPLVQTRRINRLYTTLFFLTFVISYFFMALPSSINAYFRFAGVGLVPVCLPILVIISNYINLPLELLIKKQYAIRAKHVINKRDDLIKIGITGSYGKTSTKYILNKMLGKKYKVCMTPHSFNTPMGITKVVLKYLKPEHEILITELGAKSVGDIKELCDIVKPKHGLITSIGAQHLASFDNLENIKKTKYELCEAMGSDSIMAFYGDSENTKELYEKYQGDKVLTSVKDKKAYAFASNIELSEDGCQFDLTIQKETIKCKTKLLGEHNIANIVLAAGFAHKMGVSLSQIAEAMEELEPIPHRLELKKENGLYILDNSYNSSVDGSKSALKVMSLFKTGKKIVVTPGLVELGDKEQEENENFGKNIAKVADICIIVNQIHRESIKNGLLKNKFKEKNIYFIDTLSEAKKLFPQITSVGDVILFENDLPDNYI